MIQVIQVSFPKLLLSNIVLRGMLFSLLFDLNGFFLPHRLSHYLLSLFLQYIIASLMINPSQNAAMEELLDNLADKKGTKKEEKLLQTTYVSEKGQYVRSLPLIEVVELV